MTMLDMLEVLLLMSFAVCLVIWADIYAEQREERTRQKEKEEPHGR